MSFAQTGFFKYQYFLLSTKKVEIAIKMILTRPPNPTPLTRPSNLYPTCHPNQPNMPLNATQGHPTPSKQTYHAIPRPPNPKCHAHVIQGHPHIPPKATLHAIECLPKQVPDSTYHHPTLLNGQLMWHT